MCIMFVQPPVKSHVVFSRAASPGNNVTGVYRLISRDSTDHAFTGDGGPLYNSGHFVRVTQASVVTRKNHGKSNLPWFNVVIDNAFNDRSATRDSGGQTTDQIAGRVLIAIVMGVIKA